jgi:hypothetical protein
MAFVSSREIEWTTQEECLAKPHWAQKPIQSSQYLHTSNRAPGNAFSMTRLRKFRQLGQFNGGPRVDCLGQQFSLTETSYVTVRLLQRFDTMEYPRKNSIILHNLTLMNCPEDPLEIRMHCA